MAIPSHAGIGSLFRHGDLLFEAGNYKRAARLASLTTADLRHAGKFENIAGLLRLAQDENRIDVIQSMRLATRYQAIPSGDELLFACLRNSWCEPDVFADIQGLSRLHLEVVRRNPQLSKVPANQTVGALSERLMHRYFEGTGWARVEGEIGRQGIDGLYVKLDNGVVKDVLIAESKYNSSLLHVTSDGPQMSEFWVRRKLANLRVRYPDEPVYSEIQRFVDAGSYRAVLWHVRADQDSITYSLRKIIGKGRTVEVRPLPSSDIPAPRREVGRQIQFDNPADNFDRQFLGWLDDELKAIGSLPQ